MSDLCIIDYGMGNVGSVAAALEYLDIPYCVSNSEEEISKSHKLILPGVGAFSAAMENLKKLNLHQILEKEVIENKKPILGICIGMHVFAQSSTEGGLNEGLGWIEGQVTRLEEVDGIKIPHVGWNSVVAQSDSPIFNNFSKDSEKNFYFDHSYHFECDHKLVLGKTAYGRTITSVIQKDNILATQFHPEKSQLNGLRLINNFANYFME
ncbi:MAG: imidazole glycerol phosphate synthase subunit HisH [Halobacteriovorax sp.]|nr:imidazole glycerol phosphate synthase subunit HisH [Halobacteriovorax sp.]|tara:strand:+ start:876 stop:1502 length:627 start_codon:yes stop_codon:yes gene_type:complete